MAGLIVISCEQDRTYLKYVREHVHNVQDTFEKYGKKLLEVFEYPYDQVAERIKVHDESKYSADEFYAYRQYYNPKPLCKPRQDLLDVAWKHHYQNNDHHPEYWVMEGNITKSIETMSRAAIVEMFFDWCAMGVKFNSRPDVWYNKTGYKELPFNEETREVLEKLLADFDWSVWVGKVKE